MVSKGILAAIVIIALAVIVIVAILVIGGGIYVMQQPTIETPASQLIGFLGGYLPQDIIPAIAVLALSFVVVGLSIKRRVRK